MSFTGSCLCGAVTYSASADPLATAICHCTHCQKASGSAFSVNLIFKETDLNVQGPEKSYSDTSDQGGTVLRYFCPECGSNLRSKLASIPGAIAIKAGTLDDSGSVKPAAQFYLRSAQGWVSTLSDLPGFETVRQS